jgi:hypothetical protein
VNRKAFILAGVFLAIAIAVPTIALITTLDKDIDDITSQAPNLADETQAQNFIADLEADHSTIFTIVLVVEIVCIALFYIIRVDWLKTIVHSVEYDN